MSVAAPLDADPVRAIRADAELWSVASEHPPFSNPWPDETLPDISRALLAAIPAGTGWAGHFGDRSYRQAEYLLDPTAYRTRIRTWEQRQRTIPYRTVNGDEPFARYVASGQGIPWRCSGSVFLAAAADRIGRLDTVALRREFSVAEMADLGLYKVHRDEEDAHAFARVLEQLQIFAEHCRHIAEQDLGLIITLF